jgi:hypothetical protein
MKLTVFYQQVGNRFRSIAVRTAAGILGGGHHSLLFEAVDASAAGILQRDVCTHVLQYLKDAGACRVDIDIAEQDLRSRNEKGCHDKKSSGRDVARAH